MRFVLSFLQGSQCLNMLFVHATTVPSLQICSCFSQAFFQENRPGLRIVKKTRNNFRESVGQSLLSRLPQQKNFLAFNLQELTVTLTLSLLHSYSYSYSYSYSLTLTLLLLLSNSNSLNLTLLLLLSYSYSLTLTLLLLLS